MIKDVEYYKNKYRDKIEYVKGYQISSNASTGSKFDPNANVEKKNITTMSGEIPKEDLIGVNRLFMIDKIEEMYDTELSKRYIKDLSDHIIYKHDETSIMPYCCSITLYPFLFGGLKELGGISDAPKNLRSFCGSFSNLVFAIASQFAGAVSTPEFLMYLDYFIRKDFGEDYPSHIDEIITAPWVKKQQTLRQSLDGYLQQVVYSLNQPAAARNFQSVFWNIAYFDKNYFHGMFEDFIFPDFSKPKWETTSWLQKYFMKWFNAERLRKPLTFPVETMNLLDDGEKYVDTEWADFTAEMYAEGHSFFTYRSDSVDSLASCCRLRNEVVENTFSYTLGAGGVATGSKGVITMNLNRIIQNAHRDIPNATNEDYSNVIRSVIKRIHKYLKAYNEICKDNLEAGLLSVYDAGFISMEKQFLTVGINGFVESAEFLGHEISVNPSYFEYANAILKPIYEENKLARTKDIMINTEFVPAENLGVKNAKWDKEDGYFVPRDCYNSYFYIVENEACNILDKFILHGEKTTQFLDGGSANHTNLEEHLSKEQYLNILNIAIQTKCPYFTFNVPNTICNSCGHIVKKKISICSECGSDDLDYMTRVIGYLKRVSSFSEQRQIEEKDRYYGKH